MSLLVTVIFLLASGAPAKHARVTCEGVMTVEAGNDIETEAPGAELIVDSRGAIVLGMKAPATITCTATFDTQRFSGPVVLARHGQVIRLSLKEFTYGDPQPLTRD
jgi:hypothetical protein